MTVDSYKEWIKSARLDLRDSESNHENQEYARSLYFLQQASEKAFKAASLKIGFASSEKRSTLYKEINIPIKTPKDYGHLYKDQFLDQLKAILDTPIFSIFFKALGYTNFDRTIERAKKVKVKLNPTDKEVNELINIANSLLEATRKGPLKDELNQRLKILKHRIRQLTKPSGKNINGDALLSWGKSLLPIIQSMIVSIILYEFLRPYETARYPGHFEIDGIKPHLGDVRQVIMRCLNMIEDS